jgi:glutamine synthetase
MLKAGLDGISRKLPLSSAAEEDLYHVDPRSRQLETLPGSLGEALAELGRDEGIKSALGAHIVERFVEAKSQEWDEYRLYVSQWELDRYLPIY